MHVKFSVTCTAILDVIFYFEWLLPSLAEKLTRRDFDVSMTSCHHYQENEENLHKLVDKTKLKTIVYCSKPVNHQVTSHKGKPKSSE